MPTKSQLIKQGKVFMQQNKYFEEKCPSCKAKLKIKSSEIFSGEDTYTIVCSKCNSSIEFSKLKDGLYEIGKYLENLPKNIGKELKIKITISIK